MKNQYIIFIIISLCICGGCTKHSPSNACGNSTFPSDFTSRNFKMGFTTFPYAADYNARISTYNFIGNNSDIYSEQFDNYIPWKALINNIALPKDLTDDIASRLSLKPAGKQLMLSVSLLNIMRDGLLADIDGSLPAVTSINDTSILNAYNKYVSYLVDQFHPDFLVIGMEVNEFRIKKPNQWADYLSLTGSVTATLKQKYPGLKISASVTLHNWYLPNVVNPDAFIQEIADYENAQDFVAISFYPFLKGLATKADFQKAFDFLYTQAKKPIAFTETGHIAENLDITSFGISIPSDPCKQNDYMESLLTNARIHNYAFIIWWTHRDYDVLWQTFPDSTKDIGRIWRDTGLQDENGVDRVALHTWQLALQK
ncbi:MAG TPA: glycosyl hydrolase 53 family protein [Flavisolibacter sp.]|nr:glycosyl hydrolase 53 family protein [Flavisolibacter sp.]